MVARREKQTDARRQAQLLTILKRIDRVHENPDVFIRVQELLSENDP